MRRGFRRSTVRCFALAALLVSSRAFGEEDRKSELVTDGVHLMFVTPEDFKQIAEEKSYSAEAGDIFSVEPAGTSDRPIKQCISRGHGNWVKCLWEWIFGS